MATENPFDLLGDDDNDDPTLLLAAQLQKVSAAVTTAKKTAQVSAQSAKPAKFPTKPLPPSQAVKEARNEGVNRGGRGGGRGYGRGRGGFNRDRDNNGTTFGSDNAVSYKPFEDRESGNNSEGRMYSRGGYRGGGGRRGGFSNSEAGEGERPRRTYDRRSGTGHGNEFKRDGSGRGNWGTPGDEVVQVTEEPDKENEVSAAAEKVNEEDNADANKDQPANEAEEKEPEDKEMTLEEYEKILEEKRKTLLALKVVEERKIDASEFESMQMISKKKDEEEIFIKLGSDKEKRKDAVDKEERAKKSVSINEFLKPAEGESPYYRQGGRGRGRGRGQRGGGGYGGSRAYHPPAPVFSDPGQFPSLK